MDAGISVVDLGRTAYAVALARQLECVDGVKAGTQFETLLLTEHDPVYTLGARKGAEQHLIWTESLLLAAGIEVVKTNRGGDITYHGPGQLVGYPILDLSRQRDLHAYLRDLEQLLINTVAYFGIDASRREGLTGIWIGTRKIAAIGVAVKSWISYHGFALNVHPDLNHFSGIVPCGIVDGSVTSLQIECPDSPTMEQVKSVLVLEFQKLFANR